MKTILIVDDQPGIRHLLDEVFTAEGYRAIAVGSGTEALSKAREAEPDLVLLDMKIPGMDGIEILKKLKKEQKQIQVIMMTAYGETKLIEESIAQGAACYFSKPFDVFELRDTVNQLLQD